MLQLAHRVAANDLPLPSPEIEFFCTCMYIIYNPGYSELNFLGRLNCKGSDISPNTYPPPLISLFPPFPPHPHPSLSLCWL